MKVHPQAHGAAPGSIAGLEIGASIGEGEEEGALVGLHGGGEMDENGNEFAGWAMACVWRDENSLLFLTWLDKVDHCSSDFQPLVHDSRKQQPNEKRVLKTRKVGENQRRRFLPGGSWMSRTSVGSRGPCGEKGLMPCISLEMHILIALRDAVRYQISCFL